MNYKVMIGTQRIKGGHTEWSVMRSKATYDEAKQSMQIAASTIRKGGWIFDHDNREGTTAWYLKAEDPGQVIITMKEAE